MISVLTLVKNREVHLLNLVEGLRRNNVAPAELVIVDMSDTPVVPPAADFPIKLVRLATNGLPLAKARNLAAANASSQSLLFLDVDCIPGPGLSSTMTDVLKHPDALICAEILYLTEGDTADGQWSDASLTAALARACGTSTARLDHALAQGCISKLGSFPLGTQRLSDAPAAEAGGRESAA